MAGKEPKKILVVDDEPDVVSLLTLLLTAQNYQVAVARDGAEALAKVRDEKPGLVLLDVMLPEVDGYEVARVLKSDDRYRRIPIIILTAAGQERTGAPEPAVGVEGYLTKPFETAELLERIAAVLAGKGKRANGRSK
ncbi:MAG: response regulator [Candidatus Saganbacteria bacterium]|nr:response regulator [Candidatus Saganbacteria bacterium]